MPDAISGSQLRFASVALNPSVFLLSPFEESQANHCTSFEADCCSPVALEDLPAKNSLVVVLLGVGVWL